MPGRALLCAAIGATAVSAAVASAQTTTGRARTVLAAVVSSRGTPLVDVGLDDFVVTEGGQPRDVLDVHVADYPLALVLDDRAGTAGSLPVIRGAARRFVERVGERPVGLFRLSTLASSGRLESDRSTVLQGIDELDVASATTAPPLETVARAAAMLEASGAPFSAVVVIAGAPVDASALVRGELLPAIQASGAAVHVVQAQPAAAAAVEPGEPDLLRVIADQTRGQFTSIFSTASFESALDRLADRLAIEMMVQYLVPEGPKVGDVQVGVRIPGARVVGLGVK